MLIFFQSMWYFCNTFKFNIYFLIITNFVLEQNNAFTNLIGTSLKNYFIQFKNKNYTIIL